MITSACLQAMNTINFSMALSSQNSHYYKNNFCFILGNFDIAVKKVCNIAKYKAHRDHQHKKKILKTAKNVVF